LPSISDSDTVRSIGQDDRHSQRQRIRLAARKEADMNTGRTAALCLIATVTLLAIFVGHYVFDNESKIDSQSSSHPQASANDEPRLDSDPLLREARLSDEPTQFFREPSERDAFQAMYATEKSAKNEKSSSPPKKFSGIEEASPIDDARDAVARSIIREELPRASDEERELWFDELRGMSPAAIREMLGVRRAMPLTQTAPLVKPFPLVRPGSNATATVPAPHRNFPVVAQPAPLHGVMISNLNSPPAVQPSLIAIQQAIDVIAHNIANANTVGFKRSRVELSSLPYLQVTDSGQQDSQGKLSASGVAIGMGVEVATTRVMHTQGALRRTTRPLDLAIFGPGFFQIDDGAEILYARAGRFGLNADGEMVLTTGRRSRLLDPAMTIPPDAVSVTISTEGVVSVRQPGSFTSNQVGQIQLARFTNPAGLIPSGHGLFSSTEASGTPLLGSPELEGRGSIKSQYLEASNVVIRDELAELVRLKTQFDALQQIERILGATASQFPLPPAKTAPLAKRVIDPNSGPILTRRPKPVPR
jgi:flagellar basal-body rod protein FlgG